MYAARNSADAQTKQCIQAVPIAHVQALGYHFSASGLSETCGEMLSRALLPGSKQDCMEGSMWKVQGGWHLHCI